MMILVSACLLGENCRWDGGNSENAAVKAFLSGQETLSVCPEKLGGLPIPRAPVELQQGRAIDSEGNDRSVQFQAGAEAVLRLCQKHGVKLAILKENSPSCGSRHIHDGSFTGQKIIGMGITAAKLAANGITVYSEADVAAQKRMPKVE